jgi:hypothetical protein
MSNFFEPTVNERYRVKKQPDDGSSIEPTDGGKIGTCIDKNSSSFGMWWATLRFDDGTTAIKRTAHLEPVDES